MIRISRMVAVATVIAVALPCFSQSVSKAAKPKGPSQAQVARKGAFASVGAGDASVKGAIAATDLTKARTKLSKTGIFVGVVTDVYLPKNGKRVLLDFAPNYKKAVIGLVDALNFKTFPDLRQLKKKRVLIAGKVILFKDQVQVELVSPSSIRVVR